MSEHKEITINMEELFEYVSEKTSIDMNIVVNILESEMDYLSSRGIASDGNDEDLGQEGLFVDDNELVAYIIKDTNIAKESIEAILECEMQFLDSKGLVKHHDTLN